MKIEIGDKQYEVTVLETPEEQAQGLQNVHYLPSDEGALFIYESDEERSFWMKDTFIPLDIIAINRDGEVVEVNKGIPESEEAIKFKAMFVLELNADSGIHVGDDIDFDDDDDDKEEMAKNKMMVLDENGEVQMQLDGGERIFSRHDTKILIKLSKKAYESKDPEDYKKLGKKLFKFLEIQMSHDTQYVELKDK